MEANFLYLAYNIQYSILYIYLYCISVLKMTTMVICQGAFQFYPLQYFIVEVIYKNIFVLRIYTKLLIVHKLPKVLL